MRIGRPIPPLVLTDDERERLERWARRPTTAQALAQRARVILGCAANETNTGVARQLRLTKQTVGKWRSRFLDKRLDGLLEDPRPGAPRTVSDAHVEDVVTLTLETKPRDATHWSTRAMAARCGLSQTTVSRIWRAFGLQPHRTDTFKLSPGCSAWTRSRRFRPSIGPSRSCRCAPASLSAARTTMSDTGPPRSLLRSKW
jgi:transposase